MNIRYRHKEPGYDYVVCREVDHDPEDGPRDIISRLIPALELDPGLKAKFDSKTLRVVELGCGKGQLTNYLRKRGYQCYGIDINEVEDLACQPEHFIRADIQKLPELEGLPIKMGEVDLAISTGILDLRIYPRNDQVKILEVIHQILAKGGAYFSVMIDLNASLQRNDLKVKQVLDKFEVRYIDEETQCIGLLVKK